MSWHIAKPGKEDLACLVNGHLVCTANCCDKRCDDATRGHCYRCDAIIVGKESSNRKEYGPATTIERFTSYPEEDE